MKTGVFSVRDNGAGLFMAPFLATNNLIAVRNLSEEVNNPQSVISKYPEQFSLFHLGDYDHDNGQFTNLKSPADLGLASQYKKVEPSVS